MTKRAAEWKTFYAEEREHLGERFLEQLIADAPALSIPNGGALVFPHTRLEVTGALVASVANAVIESGTSEVLAIGVLHGGTELEEFSLDAFVVLLEIAARRRARTPPKVIARYPSRVGTEPQLLPGIAELAELAERMPVVGTADPVHHGVGYGTPENARPITDVTFATQLIHAQLDGLVARDYVAFADAVSRARSDFRDVGPVLAHVLSFGSATIVRMHLVDYAAALGSVAPTWVAGPLVSLAP